MSYILDALKKSEQERREADDTPGVDSVHEVIAPRQQTSVFSAKVIVLSALAIILLSVAGIGIFLTISSSPESTNTQAVTLESERNLPEDSFGPPATKSKPLLKPSLLENTQSASIERLYQQLEREPKGVRESTDLSTPAQLPFNKPEEESQDKAGNIVSIYDLPADIRRDLPALDMSAHIYSSNVGKGFIIINGTKIYAGDHIARDVYLEKIEAESAILSYRGYFFRMDAMSSWNAI